MGIAPPALVVGAARQPLPFGLFSVFSMRPASSDRWESGVQWETITCDPVDGIGAWVPELSEVQTVTITGAPTGGTFTLTYSGQTTATIAYNAAASLVQTRLENLSNIEVGDVTVAGANGGPYTVTFRQNLVDSGDVPAMTANGAALTGGTSPAVEVAETTKGTSTTGLPKDLAANKGTDGAATEFTVYGHFHCSPVGYSVQAAQDMATMHLLSREEARVEQAFWTGDLGNHPHLFGSTVLGGGAVQPSVGIALLEDWIATNYGSLGIMHMTRGSATVLAAEDLVAASAGRLATTLGTPVVAGSGYDNTSPAGVAASAGHAWIYVSPAIFGYRSEPFTSSNRAGDLFDSGQNDLYAVAERTYLLGFDPCGSAAVEIVLPSLPA